MDFPWPTTGGARGGGARGFGSTRKGVALCDSLDGNARHAAGAARHGPARRAAAANHTVGAAPGIPAFYTRGG